MNLIDMIFNSTVIGASHREAGKECQDYSMTWQNRSGSIKIAAVSDGHGGEDYYNSALGSRLACKIASDTLKEVALSVRNIPPEREAPFVKSVCGSILARWNEAVDDLRGRDPVKSFGCTLIAYMQTREYWIGLQIGDGKLVTLHGDGRWSQPVPWDDRCILNYTTSMCDEDALNEFRYAVGHNRPDAVFLASDGIDTTFEDGELLYIFFNHILESARHEGRRKISEGLPDLLAHFSEVGSHDDMSVAAIINR